MLRTAPLNTGIRYMFRLARLVILFCVLTSVRFLQHKPAENSTSLFHQPVEKTRIASTGNYVHTILRHVHAGISPGHLQPADTARLTDRLIDSLHPGRSGRHKIELSRYENDEGGYVWLTFSARKNKGWQVKQSLRIDNILVPELAAEFADFNNDGYTDVTFESLVAARSANDVRKLLIYDRRSDTLIVVKNSDEYPNLRYNNTLRCIDAFLVYGGSSTVFLRLRKDSLQEFAGVALDDRISIYEINRKGERRILRDDSNRDWHYVRFKNYKPPVPYKN